ncbi:hypothetical protein GHT06_019100 [Daphnia sinensis]|uniref:Uncharacterized protein n=1 Tax=Daphnia sinensis TaxID=1820382 RepID=A0AAD5PN79_9CRUS|nr:hypothetical protein GHT06_019100 [Daphnia sinensis]
MYCNSKQMKYIFHGRMFTYSNVLENLRAFECALVRFVDATFDNQRSRYSRLHSSDRVRRMFFTILISLNYTFLSSFCFSKYSGYAKYRELFSLHHSRLLWWFESDEDIFHPTPHSSEFFTEITQAEMDNRLAARSTWNDVLASFDVENPGQEDFRLLRDFSHSLTSLLDYVEDQLNEE